MLASPAFQEAVRKFQMARQLGEDYGYPALTDGVKRKIFGLNAARLAGFDPEALRRQTKSDEFAKPRRLAEPFSRLTTHVAAA